MRYKHYRGNRRNVRFALTKTDEAIDNVWKATQRIKAEGERDSFLRKSLAYLRECKARYLQAVKMLDKMADSPEYYVNEQKILKQYARNAEEMARANKECFDIIQTAMNDLFKKEASLVSRYIR